MKSLTVKQPWAWLIVHGHKDIEYRSWRTSYRGLLVIIASKSSTRDTIAAANDYADAASITLPDRVEGGGIVGIVELYDITGVPGDYEWHLRNAQSLPFTARKGGLGLLECPDPRIDVPSA